MDSKREEMHLCKDVGTKMRLNHPVFSKEIYYYLRIAAPPQQPLELVDGKLLWVHQLYAPPRCCFAFIFTGKHVHVTLHGMANHIYQGCALKSQPCSLAVPIMISNPTRREVT